MKKEHRSSLYANRSSCAAVRVSAKGATNLHNLSLPDRTGLSDLSLAEAEIAFMAENAAHLDFSAAFENAKINEQIHDLLLRCKKCAVTGAS